MATDVMLGSCGRVGGCEGGMGSGGRLCYTCSFSHSDDFKRLRVAHTNFYHNKSDCSIAWYT